MIDELVTAATLRDTVTTCQGFLAGFTGAEWSAQVPGMDWTAAGTAAHIGQVLTWYSCDLSAGPAELSTMQVSVRADATPAELVGTVGAIGRMFAAVVAAAGPDTRGWHPFGAADRSGFAAMGCDELLVHTADVGSAFGARFEPPPELADATLRRLFPWAPDTGDPWQNLLWANGRVALAGRPKPDRWRWHCAPLADWDGTTPR